MNEIAGEDVVVSWLLTDELVVSVLEDVVLVDVDELDVVVELELLDVVRLELVDVDVGVELELSEDELGVVELDSRVDDELGLDEELVDVLDVLDVLRGALDVEEDELVEACSVDDGWPSW